MEERFVERKKCKRGQAKTKIIKKTKAQTKGCGENKKHRGEKEEKRWQQATGKRLQIWTMLGELDRRKRN